jgi:hypothetical protein
MNLPSIFYKYTSSEVGLINLKTFRLRWSDPSTFNDTAEFQRMPCFKPTAADAQRMLPQILVEAAQAKRQINENNLLPLRVMQLAEARRQLKVGISSTEVIQNLVKLIPEIPNADVIITDLLAQIYSKTRLETTRVLCVTTKPDNQVLWGNYAENHKGLVLGFRHIEEYSTPLLGAEKVIYSDEVSVVGSGLDFLLYGPSTELKKNARIAITCSKTKEWEYEGEWRAITYRPMESGNQYNDYLFYPEELESVTLGVRASSELQAEVRALVSEHYTDCVVYRMQDNRGVLSRHVVSEKGA